MAADEHLMKRLSAILLVCGSALLATSAVGHAQSDAYPPRSLSVTQDVDQAAPGETFSVTLTGCLDGEVADFVFAGERQSLDCDLGAGPQALARTEAPLGGATAHLIAPATTGRFVGTIELSTGQSVGNFEISVVEPVVEAIPVNVQTPNAPASTPTPDSGKSPASMILFAGFALIAAIAVFILRPQFA